MPLELLDRDRLTPARIALVYLAVGLAGIVGSDLLLPLVVREPELARLQVVKGVLEVVATAGLLYLLVTWSVRGLRLRQRALDAAPIGVTITDPDREDNPLIAVNRQFRSLTGYDGADVLGRNCRFLQGPETDDETRAGLRAAVDEERPVSVDVVNYRDDGAKFWNKLDVAPVRDDAGRVTQFVGFQTDISERKVREERLRVLNRVLRHNFRNKMTVVAGHVEILRADLAEPHASLDVIGEAVDDLQSLTETVRKSEGVLEAAIDGEDPVDLGDRLRVLVGDFRDRYPAATFDLAVPDEPVTVRGTGLVRAIEEAVDNAVRHNDDPAPTVDVCVEREREGWLRVDVADDGPGIPPAEFEVLREGETPLKHANRLGIWSMHWIVTLAGGTMTIEDSDMGGSRLTISVPSADA